MRISPRSVLSRYDALRGSCFCQFLLVARKPAITIGRGSHRFHGTADSKGQQKYKNQGFTHKGLGLQNSSILHLSSILFLVNICHALATT